MAAGWVAVATTDANTSAVDYGEDWTLQLYKPACLELINDILVLIVIFSTQTPSLVTEASNSSKLPLSPSNSTIYHIS